MAEIKTQVQTKEVILTTNASPSTTAGTMYYDSTAKTVAVQTGVPDVINQLGQELHYQVYNDSGGEITNGTPVYASGIDAGTGLIEIEETNADSFYTSASTIGLVTEDIANGAVGMVTTFGIVRDIDTSGLVVSGAVYLDSSTGGLTKTKPLHPNELVIMGTVLVSDGSAGEIHVAVNRLQRGFVAKSYSFTSNGVSSGIYYVAGFYDAPVADVTLTQASKTQAYGDANNPYAAHGFIVGKGGASVDIGDVGIKVVGTSITDAGVRTTSDEEILSDNITEIEADEYLETSKKWIGAISFELYDASGSPTTYTMDCNYGFCKYEDFGNVDFTLAGIEAVGVSGATDGDFDLEVIHHTDAGWTYHASAFVPGGASLAKMSTTHSTESDLASGENFAWKIVGQNDFVEGSASEGVLVKITTGQNATIQAMDMHLGAKIETF